MKEAIPASAMVMVTMFRMPEKITGIASGSCTRMRICFPVLPYTLCGFKNRRIHICHAGVGVPDHRKQRVNRERDYRRCVADP